jgi:hypothetical protein
VKFLLLACPDESATVTPDLTAELRRWTDDVQRSGVLVEGARLRGVSDATTVRENGRLVTDGPFAETAEQIAGYDVIDCAGRDEAVDIAARHPVARYGAVEVRPFWSE